MRTGQVTALRRAATAAGRHGRAAFAWRRRPTLYRVLVAEVLLQHTPTARVEPVYESIMKAWPSSVKLARASRRRLERTLEPLGLHRRRSRTLRDVGRAVARSVEATAVRLRRINGIGPYTAGVTAAVVGRERSSFVDGGIARMIRRYVGTPGASMSDVAVYVGALTSEGDPRLVAWGLLDISRTRCLARTPLCQTCGLRSHCAEGRGRG